MTESKLRRGQSHTVAPAGQYAHFEREAGEQTKILGFRQVVCTFKRYGREYISLQLFVRDARWRDGRSSRLGFGSFLTACTLPHRFLATTLSFDHGSQIPTTEGGGQYPLLTE